MASERLCARRPTVLYGTISCGIRSAAGHLGSATGNWQHLPACNTAELGYSAYISSILIGVVMVVVGTSQDLVAAPGHTIWGRWRNAETPVPVATEGRSMLGSNAAVGTPVDDVAMLDASLRRPVATLVPPAAVCLPPHQAGAIMRVGMSQLRSIARCVTCRSAAAGRAGPPILAFSGVRHSTCRPCLTC